MGDAVVGCAVNEDPFFLIVENLPWIKRMRVCVDVAAMVVGSGHGVILDEAHELDNRVNPNSVGGRSKRIVKA
ncbi:hypothetical protein CMV_006116 [Castanea mollissima]|uniref:Uncharacterized protein n=1 Tax=Castanea mollissima TaxID=60419 RepID=A0A8J4VTQ7_9ROSI|nr:hypothetical protein CMV_006116 [Castanea mollissima]